MRTKKIKARDTSYGDKILHKEQVFTQYDKSILDNEVWFTSDDSYNHTICLSCNKEVYLIMEESKCINS